MSDSAERFRGRVGVGDDKCWLFTEQLLGWGGEGVGISSNWSRPTFCWCLWLGVEWGLVWTSMKVTVRVLTESASLGPRSTWAAISGS